jgi:hypothetical protein
MCTIHVCTTIDKIMLQNDSQCVQFCEYNIGKSSRFFVIIIHCKTAYLCDSIISVISSVNVILGINESNKIKNLLKSKNKCERAALMIA